MRFVRLFIVFVAITAGFALIGGGIGALLGFAVPDRVATISVSDNNQSQPSSTGQVGFDVAPGINKTTRGAAVGTAFGLIAGAGVGIVIGVIDQVILAARRA